MGSAHEVAIDVGLRAEKVVAGIVHRIIDDSSERSRTGSVQVLVYIDSDSQVSTQV